MPAAPRFASSSVPTSSGNCPAVTAQELEAMAQAELDNLIRLYHEQQKGPRPDGGGLLWVLFVGYILLFIVLARIAAVT